MPKHTIIAAGPLQILGHEGTVEGGTVLATIETDCEIGSLLSSLQFGNAKVQHDEEATEGGDGDTAKTTTRRTTKRTASAAPAPTGDGSKSATPSRRR